MVIGNTNPRAQLTVEGDIYTAGRLICPSDIRLKDNITEKEAKEALENLQKLRIVDYFYKPEVAEKWGLTEEQRKRTGVIAQELATVLPDAVKDLGDYLTVNESRVFYETVLATQELCRLTGDLDQKIDEKVEEISKRLSEYAHRKKMLSSVGSNLNSEGRSLNTSCASLESSASTLTVTNTKKNRRAIRKARRAAAKAPPKKSKVTHTTVISLVGVMAFCLIAMSALYILDWHNRNYGYHHVAPPSTTSGPKEGPGNLVIPLGESLRNYERDGGDGKKWPRIIRLGSRVDDPVRSVLTRFLQAFFEFYFFPDNYVPLRQPDAPPLVPFCPTTGRCREYCCHEYDKEREGMPDFDYDPNGVEESDYSYKAETRSDFFLKNFGNNVTISLPEANMQIDERYCIEKSCARKRKVYNLFIPMTRYMPTIPIELQIE